MAPALRRHGPPPKPTVVKLREGNPGKQKLNAQEPSWPAAPAVRPARTAWWPDEAKAFWKRHVPLLRRAGVFSRADIPAMEALCLSYAAYIACQKVLVTKGYTYMSDKGNTLPRPEVSISKKALQDVGNLLCHFGMTPASKSKIMADPKLLDEPELGGLLD